MRNFFQSVWKGFFLKDFFNFIFSDNILSDEISNEVSDEISNEIFTKNLSNGHKSVFLQNILIFKSFYCN